MALQLSIMSVMGRHNKTMQQKKDYRQFYTPPPIRNENSRNASHNRRSSLLVLNSHKVKVARLMTFSSLLQRKLKTKLKWLKLKNCSYSINTMFNCSDSGYGSGMGDIITASGLENPDHVGWIMDLSCSKLRWCVVADMLFCIFENDFSEDPLNVLVLPGYKVKNLVFNSAKRSTIADITELDDRHKIDSKTVSGMLRYQFVLENHANAKSYAFGMDNKTDLEIWMSVLRNAISLDTDLFDDSDSEFEDESLVSICSSELSVGKKTSSLNDSMDSEPVRPRASTSNQSRASSGISEYSLISNGHDTKSSIASVTGIETKSSHNYLASKSCESFDHVGYVPSPRVSREERQVQKAYVKDNEQRNGEVNVPAFARVTRSSSFKDLLHNGTTGYSSDSEQLSKSKGSKSLRKIPSVDDFRKKLRINAKTSVDNGSQNVHELQSSVDCTDTGKNEKPLQPTSNNKMKKSNSFKEFFVRKSRESRILESIDTAEKQGYLHHKSLLKWTKYWCVICGDTFNAFKSQGKDSVADITLNLNECTLALVHNDKGKRIYTFKVCVTSDKSLYFSANTLNEYCSWIEILKVKTNTADLFKITDDGVQKRINKSQQHKKDRRSSVDFHDSKVKTFHRVQSNSSLLSRDSYTSTSSLDSAKSTPSITDMFKQYKNTYNAQQNKLPSFGRKHSLAAFQMRSSNLPTNEKVKQRIKDQRKYSMPTVPSYADIMEHIAESKAKEQSNNGAKKSQSYSSFSKLLFPKNKLNSKRSNDAKNAEKENEEPYKMLAASSRSKSENKLSSTDQNASVKNQNGSQIKEESIKDTHYVDSDSTTLNSSLPHSESQVSNQNESPIAYGNQNSLKEYVSTLPSKPETCIFNTHLPGPNNEGLLLVRDDIKNNTQKQKPIIEKQHYRSFSDGNINVIGITSGEKQGCRKEQYNPSVVHIPAREIESPTLQGYLDRKMEGDDDWVNIWGVLKEDQLFVYSSPIDECSVDSVSLTDWEIQQTDTMKDKDNVLVFKHHTYENQYYSSDSQSDFDHWKNDLHRRARMSSSEKEHIKKQAMDTVVPSVEELDQQKNELLKYVLSQRKQALKSIQSRHTSTGDNSSQDTDLSSSDVTDKREDDFIMVDDEQNWKDMTHLMQRKVSMQLKLDTIQRSLLVQNKKFPTKKKFKLTFNKSSKTTEDAPTPQKENLVRQVKDLNSRLSHLQLDIDEKKQQMRPNSDLPHEMQEPIQFTMERPTKLIDDKPKFKLSKKFNVAKFKNSFSTADVKFRDGKNSKQKEKLQSKGGLALRHSWSPDMWRSNMRDEDLSPTSPESSISSSSPDHKVSRLSLYSKRMSPRIGYLSSIKDLESPQEESEDMNMSISSSNVSQDTSYDTLASKFESNSLFMDTPMKDIVYRNNNKYSSLNDNEHCRTCDNEDTISSDFELDCVNGNSNKNGSIAKETTAKIEEFEDFLKIQLETQ